MVGAAGSSDVDGTFAMEKRGMDAGRCFLVGRLLFLSPRDRPHAASVRQRHRRV